MEIVLDKVWTQWIVFVIMNVVFFFWTRYELNDGGGYLSGLGALFIIPLWLVAIIAWLIIFFVIL